MTAAEILFLIFAIATCGGALAVVFSQNVARMAFWLIVSLGSTSGLVLPAAGRLRRGHATVGLRRRDGGPVDFRRDAHGQRAVPADSHVARRTGAWPVASGILLLSMIYSTVYIADWSRLVQTAGSPAVRSGRGYNPRRRGKHGPPDRHEVGRREPRGRRHTTARQLSAGYLLPFEIVSIHLLVVLIGAAYLARAKRRVEPPARRAASMTALERGGNGSPSGTVHAEIEPKVGVGASAHH